MILSLSNDSIQVSLWHRKIANKDTIWLFNMAMENPPIFKNGKPSISIRAIYTMANC